MDFFSFTSANPIEMESKAHDCDAEADRLESVISELSSGSGVVFVTWTGIGAQSFDKAITRQIAEVREAQTSLRRAASALRKGASEVRAAIKEAERRARQAEEEKRKRDAQQK